MRELLACSFPVDLSQDQQCLLASNVKVRSVEGGHDFSPIEVGEEVSHDFDKDVDIPLRGLGIGQVILTSSRHLLLPVLLDERTHTEISQLGRELLML